MRWPEKVGWRTQVAVGIAALAVSYGVAAHPHGTVQCGFAVEYKDRQPYRLSGRLLFDEAHSAQAAAALRDPVTQKIDDALQQRFLFGLKRQLGRWSWLLAASSDGEFAELTEAAAPALWWSADGRLGVLVEMTIASTVITNPDSTWTYSCQDPSRYWVSEFLQTHAAVSVAGCVKASISPAVKVATGPLAGTANISVTCAP